MGRVGSEARDRSGRVSLLCEVGSDSMRGMWWWSEGGRCVATAAGLGGGGCCAAVLLVVPLERKVEKEEAEWEREKG